MAPHVELSQRPTALRTQEPSRILEPLEVGERLADVRRLVPLFDLDQDGRPGTSDRLFPTAEHGELMALDVNLDQRDPALLLRKDGVESLE